MWAFRATGPLTFERIEVPTPDPTAVAATDVLVRLRAGGICGSDLPEARGLVPTRTPASGLGPLHEIVGDVVSAPGGRFTQGERVVGWARDQHGLSELVIGAEGQLHPVPDELSDVDAVLAQILACVLCAVDRLGDVAGRRAVVLGQGPAGLLFDHLLVGRGASVTGIDPVDRSGLAAAMGASFQHTSSRGWAHQTAAGDRPEIVVEAVGHQAATLDHALHGVAPGGQVYLFGVNDDPYYAVDVQHLMRKNLTLRAGITVDHPRYLQAALDHLLQHPQLAPTLSTHTFDLDRLDAAFAAAADLEPTRGKVVITMATGAPAGR
jgi:threonine dehydrogenase-like Zn-dependent dehydrogenase